MYKQSGLMPLLALLCLIAKITTQEPVGTTRNLPLQCRERLSMFPKPIFNIHTCAMCYHYLFQFDGAPLKPLYDPLIRGLVLVDVHNKTKQFKYLPDVKNETLWRPICGTLNYEQCNRWRSCCTAAYECCDDQLRAPPTDQDSNQYCGRTWDGWGCWKDTPSGKTATNNCPAYIHRSSPTNYAIKTCWNNGTWLKKDGFPWTDYIQCIEGTEQSKTLVFIALGCNILSLLALVPGVIVYLRFRKLRLQQRIKIHINFFISFIISNVVIILWNMLLHYDLLTNVSEDAPLMRQNTAGCKLLSSLKLYSTSNNYVWMFCEAYYLHRLITNALNPPKKIIPLYVFGWAFPAIPVTIYSVLRAVYADTDCWVIIRDREYDWIQWVIYAPNLMFIAANLIFLLRILFVMATLHSHPQDQQSSFKRALKATFILIPLFGLQLFVQVYSFPADNPAENTWAQITTVIRDTQGFFVALVFCFLNGEVMQCIKDSCRRMRRGSIVSTNLTMTTRTSLSSSFVNFCRKRGSSAVSFGKNRGSNASGTPKGSMPSINGSQVSVKTTPKIADRNSNISRNGQSCNSPQIHKYMPVPSSDEKYNERQSQI